MGMCSFQSQPWLPQEAIFSGTAPPSSPAASLVPPAGCNRSALLSVSPAVAGSWYGPRGPAGELSMSGTAGRRGGGGGGRARLRQADPIHRAAAGAQRQCSAARPHREGRTRRGGARRRSPQPPPGDPQGHILCWSNDAPL